jgi:glycosyltransferase involved in cell wall biosynthesis
MLEMNRADRMKLLWTTPYIPWPTTAAGKAGGAGAITRYETIRRMAERGHKITLLALARDPVDDATRRHMETFLHRFYAMDRRPRSAPTTLVRAALSVNRPAIATVNGCNIKYKKQFKSLLNEGHFDLVQVEHSYACEPFIKALEHRHTPFVLTEHNVESRLIHAQYRRFGKLLQPLARLDAMRARLWEQRVLRAASCVIAYSEDDSAAFRKAGAAHTAIIPNGIDVTAAANTQPNSASRSVCFLGNFQYSANVDAVEWLCDTIMPLVWSRNPDVKLSLYGYGLDAAWRQRWDDTRITFVGHVERVGTAHGANALFVAPLRFGGGSKLKVLEALASGMPLVATSEGLTGLAAQDGVNVLRSDSAEGLAYNIVRLIDDPQLAHRLGAGARALAKQYDWESVVTKVETVYRDCIARETGGGRTDFASHNASPHDIGRSIIHDEVDH